MSKRNYINAIVELNHCKTRIEVIFKVGEVDLEDDMHVFAYLKSEDEIETLMGNDHLEFQVIEYWKGPQPNQELFEFDEDDFSDWLRNSSP